MGAPLILKICHLLLLSGVHYKSIILVALFSHNKIIIIWNNDCIKYDYIIEKIRYIEIEKIQLLNSQVEENQYFML